jgi:hypothetical protein
VEVAYAMGSPGHCDRFRSQAHRQWSVEVVGAARSKGEDRYPP